MLDRLAKGEDPIDIAILKYEGIIKGERAYSGTCALCEVYKDCYGCPVMRKTGRQGCNGTPFWSWFNNQSINNARKFLEFLKELKKEVSNGRD